MLRVLEEARREKEEAEAQEYYEECQEMMARQEMSLLALHKSEEEMQESEEENSVSWQEEEAEDTFWTETAAPTSMVADASTTVFADTSLPEGDVSAWEAERDEEMRGRIIFTEMMLRRS
jgi:hypothetical protein